MVGYVLGGAFKNSILFERLFFFNIDQTFLLKMGGSLTCGSAKKIPGEGATYCCRTLYRSKEMLEAWGQKAIRFWLKTKKKRYLSKKEQPITTAQEKTFKI